MTIFVPQLRQELGRLVPHDLGLTVSSNTLDICLNAQSVHSEISRMGAMTIRQILIDTDLPLSEVADTCGFASTSHFNAFFRKAVGKTPGEYRRENKA